MNFSHLHVHTQFSLLDGAADISSLYKKAVNDNMRALAITDHGNMFGVFKFVAEAGKYNTPENPNKIKPIVGCEFYVVENRNKRQFTKEDKDIRYHQLFLAKNPSFHFSERHIWFRLAISGWYPVPVSDLLCVQCL